MMLEAFLQRLQDVRPTAHGFMARCPAHTDRGPSLSVCEGADGRILLHDFAGCRVTEIVGALGLQLRALFPDDAVLPLRRNRTPLEELRDEIKGELRRRERRLAPYREAYAEADLIRAEYTLAAAARRLVTAQGETSEGWDLLALAARLETAAANAEAA